MTRVINTHKLNGLNEAIKVLVLDGPGPGNANHQYLFEWGPAAADGCFIKFQEGPIKEAGINGISNEALLAVLIDRMQGFQMGPFRSEENAITLVMLEQALYWLQKRTRDRMARGVEGENKL